MESKSQSWKKLAADIKAHQGVVSIRTLASAEYAKYDTAGFTFEDNSDLLVIRQSQGAVAFIDVASIVAITLH
jgi:hypothetical protein